MGQFMPSSLIPSTLTESYSVDATQQLEFSCQINGTSPTIKYRLQIMQNNASSTLVYDTNVVTLNSPLYPVDYNGNPNELVVSIPANTMQNNNTYKWTITSYWDNGNIQSYENVFYTYSIPTLSINTIPQVIGNNSYTFTATYMQAQNIGVEKFGWILQNVNTKEVLIDTINQNNIFSSDIQLYYDGFFTNNTYQIMCQCWASNGVVVSTPFEEFTVSYEVNTMSGTVVASQQYDSGIYIEWPALSAILGEYTAGSGAPNTPSYYFNEIVQSQVITLSSGTSYTNYSSISFDTVNSTSMEFPISSSHILSFNLNNYNAVGAPIYTVYLNNEDNTFIQIYFNANRNFSIRYENNGEIIYDNEFYETTRGEKWYIFSIIPNESTGNFSVGIFAYGYVDMGLFPSMSLYPSTSLYPLGPNTLGIIDTGNFDTSIPYSIDGNITKLELYSQNDINYLLLLNNIITNEELQNYYVLTYEPEWTFNTEFLATFDGDLNAGNIASIGTLTKWMVYRNTSNSPQLIHIYDADPMVASVTDYGAANQTEYIYYVYPVFDSGIGQPIQSNNITTNWWSWILLVCSPTSTNNVLQMDTSFIFDMDVSSGNMSNNTSYSVLENFTQYAKIQNSNSNYWTGTLTSLLGNITCSDNYSDTVQQMNSIKMMSSDTRTKILKDRKGNVWMVRLNSPITEKINDQYIEQAVNVTITWMEVGSIDGVSIVSTSSLQNGVT